MHLKQAIRHPLARNLFAILLVCLAAILRAKLLHGGDPSRPWLVFYPAVLISAIFGGLATGLLATGLSCVFVLWPLLRGLPAFRNDDWIALIVFLLIGTTISALGETARRTRQRVTVYHTLIDSLDEGFSVIEMLYDSTGKPIDYRFLEFNPAFETHTGFKDARGKTIRQLVPGHEDHWIQIYGKVAETGEEMRFELPAAAMNRFYNVFAFRVGGPGSHRVGILFKDITELKNHQDALIVAALYDKVTGLPNRAMFRDYFTKALARADRDHHNVALLFLDLDGFKAINDTLGHQAGDTMLSTVAQRLLANVRAGDLVSRFGGDEFAVILENCQPDFLEIIAQRFILALEAPVDFEGQTAAISASIGIVTYPCSGADEQTLIQRADEAMYAVKNAGKSGYKIWQP